MENESPKQWGFLLGCRVTQFAHFYHIKADYTVTLKCWRGVEFNVHICDESGVEIEYHVRDTKSNHIASKPEDDSDANIEVVDLSDVESDGTINFPTFKHILTEAIIEKGSLVGSRLYEC